MTKEQALLKHLDPCYENKEQMAEDIGSPVYLCILAAIEEFAAQQNTAPCMRWQEVKSEKDLPFTKQTICRYEQFETTHNGIFTQEGMVLALKHPGVYKNFRYLSESPSPILDTREIEEKVAANTEAIAVAFADWLEEGNCPVHADPDGHVESLQTDELYDYFIANIYNKGD